MQVSALLDEGVYDNEKYKQGGWVTDLWYEDQVMQTLKERTGGKPDIIRGVGFPSLCTSCCPHAGTNLHVIRLGVLALDQWP